MKPIIYTTKFARGDIVKPKKQYKKDFRRGRVIDLTDTGRVDLVVNWGVILNYEPGKLEHIVF